MHVLDLTCWPGLQKKLAMSTRRPSTVIWPWLTSCRAAAIVGAKPKRKMVLSRRISSSCSRISPVDPFCFLQGAQRCQRSQKVEGAGRPTLHEPYAKMAGLDDRTASFRTLPCPVCLLPAHSKV